MGINRKPLKEIFESHGCDKAAHGFDKLYTLLAILKEPARILEIGVMEGASMRSWHEAFNDAYIMGIENNQKRNIVLPEDRCEVIFEDVKKVHLTDKFNWIIDDGSHKAIDVRTTFEMFWDSLVPGGWYVIEDVHCSFRDAYPDYGGWWEWLCNTVAVNLHQLGEEEKLNPDKLPVFGWVIQDKSIIAIQKR